MRFGMFGRGGVPKEAPPRRLMVNTGRCPQNHPCPAVRVCPAGALSQKGFDAPEVDGDQCVRCGKCVKFCPMRALTLE